MYQKEHAISGVPKSGVGSDLNMGWALVGEWERRLSRSFKVTGFGTNQKLMYDFLLVINTNLPILHRF